MKLYIVVRQDISPGAQIAQSLHAFREYIEQHPECERRWYQNSNTIVVLGCHDQIELEELIHGAIQRNIKSSPFKEPDWDNELTACAFEPGSKTGDYLARLRPALKM